MYVSDADRVSIMLGILCGTAAAPSTRNIERIGVGWGEVWGWSILVCCVGGWRVRRPEVVYKARLCSPQSKSWDSQSSFGSVRLYISC